MAHRKSRSWRDWRRRKTARAFLESPQKRKQAVGVRTRRQAQLEDIDMVAKKEDNDADGLGLDLPCIDHIICQQVMIIRFVQGGFEC